MADNDFHVVGAVSVLPDIRTSMIPRQGVARKAGGRRLLGVVSIEERQLRAGE